MTSNTQETDDRSGFVAAELPSEHLHRGLELCYGRLARRDQTASELRRVMERAGVEAAASEQALAMLAELGYVDDARFARRFAADRRELDGWGGKRIRARLEAAGVERELIEVALAEHAPQGDELESALAVLRQRIPQPPADERACQRALGVLVRRGYESEVAYEAVRLYARQHRDAA